MGAPGDITSRLDMIDEACKKEIISKQTEIENKRMELEQKRHVSGITRGQESEYHGEIARLQKDYRDLSNNRIALSLLTNAIHAAFNEIQEWTPGTLAAIVVVEKYSMYLKQIAEIDAVVTQGSQSVNLLTDEIKKFSADKGTGGRIISALQGLGLAVAGLIFGVLTVVMIIPNAYSDCNRDTRNLARETKNLFAKAFECFKETWTGKIEPPELKKLSHELKALNKQYSQVTSVANNPHAFHTQSSKKGSPDDGTTEGLRGPGTPPK